MKSAAETTPEPIPPVHVLEAAQRQERKETEDLLAGFDKPGRSPRRNPSGDFVDYYARKKEGRPVGTPSTPSHEVRPVGRPDASTVIIPRKKPMPWWMPYAAVTAIMMTLVGAIAYIATSDGPTKTTPNVPSASATTSSALPVSTTTTTIDIPPPDPPTMTQVVTTSEVPTAAPTTTAPLPPRKRTNPTTATSGSSTPPATDPAPSGSNGYIRSLVTGEH